MTKYEQERFDRVDQHLKLMKSDVNDVLTALVGTNANGKKGLISDVNKIEAEVKLIKAEIELIKLENGKKDVVFEQLKYGFAAVFVGFVGVIIKLIFTK
jgi:hypothetical protein